MKNDARKKQQGEVYTPRELVNELIDNIPKETFIDSEASMLDSACGNGNFLVGLYERIRSYGHSPKNALSRIHGVDIMLDNVVESIVRLYNIEYKEGEWDHKTFLNECRKVKWYYQDTGKWVKYSPEHGESGYVSACFRYKGYKIYNFVCANFLRYHCRFDGTHVYDDDPVICNSLFKY